MKATFEYLGEDKDFEGAKFWQVDAIHVTTTGNKRKFTKMELEKAARSLSFRPLDINHDESRVLPFPQNSTMEMNFNPAKMAVSGRIRVQDHVINTQIESGFLRDVSIEQIPTAGESCNEILCEQHGVAFVGLALLESGIMPGDPRAKIIRNESISFTEDVHNLLISNEQRTCVECSDFTPCHECKHRTEAKDQEMTETLHKLNKTNPKWTKDELLAAAISETGLNNSNQEAWGWYKRFTPLTEALVAEKAQ